MCEDGPHQTPDMADTRERALILDAGLDGRVMEMLRYRLLGQARMLGIFHEGERGQIRFEGMGPGGRLRFAVTNEVATMDLDVPRSDYDVLAFGLAHASFAAERPPAVDQAWARDALARLRRERLLF